MKITKQKLKEIIKEESSKLREGSDWYDTEHETLADKEYSDATTARRVRQLRGRFDKMFEKGQPGNIFAEAVSSELMLDEEEDFLEVVQALKDGLDDWYEARWAGK
jgi:hypothetical protein